MSKMSEKMYGNSPKMEREESGKMAVKKKVAEKDGKDMTGEGEDKGSGEAVPMAARHMMERSDMHGRHEKEHALHDHGKHGDKHGMHERHRTEMASMHKAHEKEMKEHTPEMGEEKK